MNLDINPWRRVNLSHQIILIFWLVPLTNTRMPSDHCLLRTCVDSKCQHQSLLRAANSRASIVRLTSANLRILYICHLRLRIHHTLGSARQRVATNLKCRFHCRRSRSMEQSAARRAKCLFMMVSGCQLPTSSTWSTYEQPSGEAAKLGHGTDRQTEDRPRNGIYDTFTRSRARSSVHSFSNSNSCGRSANAATWVSHTLPRADCGSWSMWCWFLHAYECITDIQRAARDDSKQMHLMPNRCCSNWPWSWVNTPVDCFIVYQ